MLLVYVITHCLTIAGSCFSGLSVARLTAANRHFIISVLIREFNTSDVCFISNVATFFDIGGSS